MAHQLPVPGEEHEQCHYQPDIITWIYSLKKLNGLEDFRLNYSWGMLVRMAPMSVFHPPVLEVLKLSFRRGRILHRFYLLFGSLLFPRPAWRP